MSSLGCVRHGDQGLGLRRRLLGSRLEPEQERLGFGGLLYYSFKIYLYGNNPGKFSCFCHTLLVSGLCEFSCCFLDLLLWETTTVYLCKA